MVIMRLGINHHRHLLPSQTPKRTYFPTMHLDHLQGLRNFTT